MNAVSSIRVHAADTLALIHALIVSFFATGWVLPWSLSWWAVLIGGVLLQLMWLLMNNTCPLTLLENWLRGNSTVVEAVDSEPPHFVASLLSRVSGRQVTPFVGDLIAYGVLNTSMLLAALRLWS